MGQHLDQSQGEETNFSAPLLFSFPSLVYGSSWLVSAQLLTVTIRAFCVPFVNSSWFYCRSSAGLCSLKCLDFFHPISDFPALFL